MGLGAGGEYSLDGDYISEIMPKRWGLFMVGVAKAACSVGNVLLAVFCFLFLLQHDTAYLWNKLVLIISGIALLMFLLRMHFAQSPGWLVSHGRIDEARASVRFFLGDDVDMGEKATRPPLINEPKESIRILLNKQKMPKIIFSGFPWACSGMGVYGIGIFLPILIMALGLEKTTMSPLEHVIFSVKNTAYISLFKIGRAHV